MTFTRWFRSPFAPRPAARKSLPARRLLVECLEDRTTPSGGLLDSTWSLPSSLGNVTATAVQPDGKVVAVGTVTIRSGTYGISVVRMNPNGSLDPSFNGTGRTTITVTNDTRGLAVTFQADGKILVGGTAATGKGFSIDNEFVVAQLNAGGTLDNAFGSRGVWTYNPTPGPEMVEKLALLADGSIIGGGEGRAADGYEAFAAFKLTPAGALNSSFGTGGLTTVHVGTQPNGPQNSLAVTTSGEVVLAGYAQPVGAPMTFGCLVALTPAGRLDTNFNGTGYLVQNFGGPGQGTEFDAVAAQGNTIVVAGIVSGGGTQGLVARYTLSGALDTSFNAVDPIANPNGTPGYFATTAAAYTEFTAIGLEPDGSIALGGWGYYTAADGSLHSRGLVAHLSANGVLDAGFGPDGTGFAYFDGVTSTSNVTMSVGPDGSLLLSGWTGNPVHTVFARFTAP